MSFKKQYAEAVKAALEISKRYSDKEMPGDEKEKFSNLVKLAADYKQLAQQEEDLTKMQSDLSNGEVATEQFKKETTEKKSENVSNWQKFYEFAKFGRHAQNTSNEIEQFLHKEADPGLGGSFVPPGFVNEVSMGLADYATIRPNVTVRTTRTQSYSFPRIKGAGAIYPSDYVSNSWKSEGMGISDNGAAIPAQSTPTTQLVTITPKLWAPDAIVITREMMQDAPTFEMELKRLFAIHMGLELDDAYLNGDGISRPRGILTYAEAGITAVNSGSTTAVTYAGLVNLKVALPRQYQGKFYMNQNTLGSILKLAGSTNDHPIFAAGLVLGQLFNSEIVVNPFLPDIASASYSILFGDLRFYRAVDRADMEVIRLVERYAPHVALIPVARFGGDVEEFQAFRVQKFSV